jgi:hypothetical protein
MKGGGNYGRKLLEPYSPKISVCSLSCGVSTEQQMVQFFFKAYLEGMPLGVYWPQSRFNHSIECVNIITYLPALEARP